MYDLIPLIIILASFLIILIILIRKFPVLAVIDTQNLPEEKQAQIKHKILEERVLRDTKKFLDKGQELLLPIWKVTQKAFRIGYHKVLEIERKYRHQQKVAATPEQRLEVDHKVRALLNEIEELKKDEENKHKLEKKYIEIISLDNHRADAYIGLGMFYLEKGDYKKAEETLLFASKLASQNGEIYNYLGKIAQENGNLQEAKIYFTKAVEVQDKNSFFYIDLGSILQKLEEKEKALEVFAKAAELEPNNPKNLDYLLEASIMVGNHTLAEETYKKLAEVNPENQKLGEFKQKIEEIKNHKNIKA